MRWFIILFLANFSWSQDTTILVIGNYENVCLHDYSIEYSKKIPKDLSKFQVIFLFSSAEAAFGKGELNSILEFVKKGGGLYCGAENWPLQSESNQITDEIYLKSRFGNYTATNAQASEFEGNLKLKELDSIPSGKTAVAFPMDHRLRVEAWIEDQPLIQTGELENGNVIIDGGYSRFYCDQRNQTTDEMLEKFLNYLLD